MSVCRGTIQAGQSRQNNSVVQRTNNPCPEPLNMRFWTTLLFVAILLKHSPLLVCGAIVKVVYEGLDAARENGSEHQRRYMRGVFAVSGEWAAEKPVYGSSR
jgi:hypothetical protein